MSQQGDIAARAPSALMLFAAGFGTRMGALTQDRPKPLIEVAGRPLLDHTLDLVQGTGITRIVVNTHYKADQIASHLAAHEEHSRISISHEADEILDTGGGLRAALPLLDSSPVFTMNTDAIWRGPNPLRLLADAWRDDMDALLLCLPPEQAIGHPGKGDFELAADGRTTRGPGLVYSGAQIIRSASLEGMPQGAFSLNMVWDKLIACGRLNALSYPGTWCDVGHPGGIALAEDLLDAPDV